MDIEALLERIRNDVARQHANNTPTSLVPTAPPYAPGTLLRFGKSGNAGPYAVKGWSHPEEMIRWTDGSAAELNFAFIKPPGDLVLTFTAHPFLGGSVEAQEVLASWNGVPVGEWSIREAKSYHTILLSHLVSNAPLGVLMFSFPVSLSPLSIHQGTDSRQLGLAFHELVLRPASELGL